MENNVKKEDWKKEKEEIIDLFMKFSSKYHPNIAGVIVRTIDGIVSIDIIAHGRMLDILD